MRILLPEVLDTLGLDGDATTDFLAGGIAGALCNLATMAVPLTAGLGSSLPVVMGMHQSPGQGIVGGQNPSSDAPLADDTDALIYSGDATLEHHGLIANSMLYPDVNEAFGDEEPMSTDGPFLLKYFEGMLGNCRGCSTCDCTCSA